MGRTTGAVIATGTIVNTDISAKAEIAPSKMGVMSRSVTLPLTSARVWDSLDLLPTSAAADDLALVCGTPGTDFPVLTTEDVKATNATRKCAFLVSVPERYVEGGALSISVTAGMKTTISDGTATLDVNVYLANDAGGVDSTGDLCTTAAKNINSLTPATNTFDLDASAVKPGSQIQVILSVAIDDTATGTAVIGEIYRVELTAVCRG